MYRADLLIEKLVLAEVNAVQTVEAIHLSQLLSYLRLGGFKLAVLFNLNTELMKNGIRRIATTSESLAFFAPLR